jgi:hypothetical protein
MEDELVSTCTRLTSTHPPALFRHHVDLVVVRGLALMWLLSWLYHGFYMDAVMELTWQNHHVINPPIHSMLQHGTFMILPYQVWNLVMLYWPTGSWTTRPSTMHPYHSYLAKSIVLGTTSLYRGLYRSFSVNAIFFISMPRPY